MSRYDRMPGERICGLTLPSMQAAHDATQWHLLDMPHLRDMRVKKLPHETLKISPMNQTPFERFKAVVAQVLSVPKSSLPKTHKKTR